MFRKVEIGAVTFLILLFQKWPFLVAAQRLTLGSEQTKKKKSERSNKMMFYGNQLKVTETVRWPSEAVGGWDESTASEGHRTKLRIQPVAVKYTTSG